MPAHAFRMYVLALFFVPFSTWSQSHSTFVVMLLLLRTYQLHVLLEMRRADPCAEAWSCIFAVPGLSMNFQAGVPSCKEQVEQVRRPCACVVRCVYHPRLSLATVNLLSLYCPSLEEALFIKSFKTSSPCCVGNSCLCGQEFPSNLVSHIWSFSTPQLFLPQWDRSHQSLFTEFHRFCWLFSLPYGNWTSASSCISGKFIRA